MTSCKQEIQILGGGTTLDSHRELSIVIVKLYKACHHDRPFLYKEILPSFRRRSKSCGRRQIILNGKEFYVYIITNKKLGTIYIGYSNDMKDRMKRHKGGHGSLFAKRYNLDKLVYYEKYKFPNVAIKREKQLKKWKREWKINLINDFNPNWEDLSYFFD